MIDFNLKLKLIFTDNDCNKKDNCLFLLRLKLCIFCCLHCVWWEGLSKSISICQVLVDMIRIPDWAFEAAGQEMRGMGQDAAAYHPGLYLTTAQVLVISLLLYRP